MSEKQWSTSDECSHFQWIRHKIVCLSGPVDIYCHQRCVFRYNCVRLSDINKIDRERIHLRSHLCRCIRSTTHSFLHPLTLSFVSTVQHSIDCDSFADGSRWLLSVAVSNLVLEIVDRVPFAQKSSPYFVFNGTFVDFPCSMCNICERVYSVHTSKCAFAAWTQTFHGLCEHTERMGRLTPNYLFVRRFSMGLCCASLAIHCLLAWCRLVRSYAVNGSLAFWRFQFFSSMFVFVLSCVQRTLFRRLLLSI